MLGRISPLVAESPLLQATKNEPPFTYEQPRDCLKTTPLRYFTHKVEMRVLCVLARNTRLTYQELIFGYGRKEENNFSSSKKI